MKTILKKINVVLVFSLMLTLFSGILIKGTPDVSAEGGSGAPNISDVYVYIFTGQKYAVTVYNTNVKSIKSSNSKVATGTKKGKSWVIIKAKSKGTATIKVTTTKKTFSVKVTIYGKNLDKSDFKVTNDFDDSKTQFIGRSNDDYDLLVVSDVNGSYTTNRNFSIKNDLDGLFEKYPKKKLQKFDAKSDRVYKYYAGGHTTSDDSESASEIAKYMKDTYAKYVDYDYKGGYKIRFYIDSTDFVMGIAYIKNYSKLP